MHVHFLINLFYYPNAITKQTTYALGDNHYNPRYSFVHDNWLTSWFSSHRAFGLSGAKSTRSNSYRPRALLD